MKSISCPSPFKIGYKSGSAYIAIQGKSSTHKKNATLAYMVLILAFLLYFLLHNAIIFLFAKLEIT